MEAGRYPDCYILGDNGYSCKNYLLIPLLNLRTPAEQAYSRAHILTRNIIERAFGVVKRRFSCLSIGMRLKMNTALAMIVACFVLHNIAVEMNDVEPPIDININIPINDYNAVPINPPRLQNQTAARTALINTVFSQQ
ncbi:hypothetical protein ILUMI_18390 [Ignelater luminosus]|uniref:DDE Tnp4 domain-containing protein n=1 Tax=Ignelater luminosus TaxID=2038154 RepID=A0A8K0CI35_IGNLU|nr:hypothetical protein ILUMI_18390 [Ignelater luminosus]